MAERRTPAAAPFLPRRAYIYCFGGIGWVKSAWAPGPSEKWRRCYAPTRDERWRSGAGNALRFIGGGNAGDCGAIWARGEFFRRRGRDAGSGEGTGFCPKLRRGTVRRK